MKFLIFVLCSFVGVALAQGQGQGNQGQGNQGQGPPSTQCGCGTPCLVGMRLYWSHEGVNAVLRAWVQSAWTVGTGREAAPERLEMVCRGDATRQGKDESDVEIVMEFTTYVVPNLPLGHLDLQADIAITAIGDVQRKWGQGVVEHIEVGATQLECCISGQSRFTPLENAEDCSTYNICVQVDLRATNEGPKPIGSESQSGLIDRLFTEGFVLSSVCSNAVIDLEAVDESEDSGSIMFFEQDVTKPGTSHMAEIAGVVPSVSVDGFFSWPLNNVEEPDGIHSVNIVVEETEFAGAVPLRGTMDLDFLVAIDPTDPFCEFTTTSDLSVRVGETFSGTVLVEDRDVETQFANVGDRIDVSPGENTDPFDSEPQLPIVGHRSPFEITFSATCASHGTKTVTFDLQDTCAHQFSCSLSYNCLNSCGDGIVAEDERCEPQLDDDCRADCTKCGDGKQDPRWGEFCDDGNFNDRDGCRRDCTNCGDGEVQPDWDETCDPGEDSVDSVDSDDGGCREDCTMCGDGVVDRGEACDDGNDNNLDSCRNDCMLAFCGDGIVDPGEECDDGDDDNEDGCRDDCTLPFCGDGLKDRGEECDDNNDVNEDECRNDCTLPYCGDGIVDDFLGELCDDGNDDDEDGCDQLCHVCPELYYIPEKEFVCSISCDLNGIYQAAVHDLETFEADWFYPGTTWFDTEFDCWCQAICEEPPEGHTFVCMNNGCEWILASPMTEPVIGPNNDLLDLLEAGAFPPGSVHDGQFFDCWCRAWDI